MHRLTHRFTSGAAAVCAVALLGSCGQPPDGTSDARKPSPAKSATATTQAPPSARGTDGSVLRLVAGRWSEGRGETPPRRLTWERPDPAGDRRPVKVTVTAAAPPSYASFMAHSRIDGSGIPDEDTRRQKVLACGVGIESPGCRITDHRNGTHTIEVLGAPPAGHPYRVLYVQWAPHRPGAEETWASWQLPTG
ncbi:hypothetical protein JNUCC64_08540 [Streptomyces sp. JNUCC 64]